MADSTITAESRVAKPITLQAPRCYEEVLMIVPRQLPCNENINCFYHVFEFFLDVIDSSTQEMLTDIRGYCVGEHTRDALVGGEGAICRLRRIIREMREDLRTPDGDYVEGKTGWEKFNSAQAKWEQVLQAFALAHDEAFCAEGELFSEYFEKWKHGKTDLS